MKTQRFLNDAISRSGWQPLVSIVINNYNYARFVSAAIDSALAQTYPNIEIIVVDDGSTDDSRQVIESYGKRIKGIFKDNGGQGSALNCGYAAASGELIYFLDADDIALPDCLAQIVEHYAKSLDEAVTFQFKLQIIDKDGHLTEGITPDMEKLQGSKAFHLLETKGSYVHPPTSGNIFSRRLLQKIMPIPEDEYRISADLYLCTLAALTGTIEDIEETLGQYRIHGANHCARLSDTEKRFPIETYVEKMIDESSARSQQKKICAAHLRRPIGGNTDLLFLLFSSTKQKLLKSSGGFKLARRSWSNLRRDASLVPLKNKFAALLYLMSIAMLPRTVVRRLVELLFIHPPKPFEMFLKKSFGR